MYFTAGTVRRSFTRATAGDPRRTSSVQVASTAARWIKKKSVDRAWPTRSQLHRVGSAWGADQRKTTAQTDVKCGTPVYMEPEMFADNPKYNESVDVWATGVLLYIMLSGALPFYSDDPMEFASVLAEAEENLVFHDEDWTHVSDEAKALIQQILVSDPMRRLKSPQILGHPWVVGNATQSPGGSQAPLDRHRLKFDWGGPVAVSAKPVQAHTAHVADANVGGPSGGWFNESDVVKLHLGEVDRTVRSGDDDGKMIVARVPDNTTS